MQRSVLAWYYLALFLIVVAFFVATDFSPFNASLRFFILTLAAAAIVAPIIFSYVSARDHRNDQASVGVLASANRDLEASVKQLENKLRTAETANQRLQAVDKAKSDFVGSVAHQLRTPLSAIKWTFHMMLNGELGPVTEDQKTFLSKGFDGVNRIITVINDWLNLDYIETGHDEYKFVPIDLTEMVDSVAFEFNARLVERNIRLVVDKPKSNMPLVVIDPIKFSMVLENLIDNAIKYSRPGGEVRITINDDRVLAEAPEVELRVKDAGIGIPAAEQSKIFERFFRSSNAAKSVTQGTGLGLSIAKSIVERHGGTIRFESVEGVGTTFIITIPLKQNKV